MRQDWFPLIICIAFIVCIAAVSGCGGKSEVPRQAEQAPQALTSRLIHSPPVDRLAPQQLRALSMECEKYAPDKSARGPYDAAYCEQAMAAWSDAPLQIVPIPKDPSPRQP
jgi:hypothetical protein